MAKPESAAKHYAPRLLNYLNYRDFIRDHYDYRKQGDPRYSQRAFAREAKIPPSCSSLLPSIIKGRRNLSPNLLIKFAKALDLSDRDFRYFELLVHFNQAKGMVEKKHYFNLLSKFRSSRARILEEGQFRYYSKWYYSAVWTYFSIEQKQRHPGVIASSIFPAMTAAQVEDSINLLLALELIRKTASGYVTTDKHLYTEKDLRAMATRQHLQDLNGIAMQILDSVPPDRRQYNALMFSVSETGFQAVKERIRSFQEELRGIIDRDKHEDRIYTLTMQLFPNSQSKEGPGLGLDRRATSLSRSR